MRLRNRIIKATFYTDPELLRWPRAKREFYRSLWACADDSACIEDDMFGVKVAAWPSPLDSDMTEELFIVWRDELIAAEKLIPYTNGHAGHRYLYIPTMAEHECPRNPQAPDYPLPPWVNVELKGTGQSRRISFTHGDWRDFHEGLDCTVTVQSAYSDCTRTPALPCPALSSPALSSPVLSSSEDDAPKSASLYAVLLKTWELVTMSIPSEASKRALRGMAEMGYSESAVESALKVAVENHAKSPADYAKKVLMNGSLGKELTPDGFSVDALRGYDNA